MKIDGHTILGSPLLNQYWYYKVEIIKDLFTPGDGFSNVALTRKLLRNVDVKGAHCFDFGTMEGLVPVLLAKRGASRVVAVDTLNYQEKIELVKALHNVSFEYHASVQLDDTVPFMRRKWLNERGGPRRFDVVVVSGVLYHVFSPIHLLGYARSLVRPDGVVIVETAAFLNDTHSMQYNFNGSHYIYKWKDTWFLSVPLLDYLLRYCRLAPDCIYMEQPGLPIRIGIACRAGEKVLPDVNEDLMADCKRNLDYSLIVEDDPPGFLPDALYESKGEGLVMRKGTGTCDLFASCTAMSPYVPADDEIVLRLHATF